MSEKFDLRASRRIVFQGLGALGVAAALAGCGGGGDSGDAAAPEPGTALAATADVPVGGGLILGEEKIVLTQPTAGEFKAFTAVCTHQGCLVETSSEGDIPCPCHGSRFSLADGTPQSGPASAPLAPIEITVDGDSIINA